MRGAPTKLNECDIAFIWKHPGRCVGPSSRALFKSTRMDSCHIVITWDGVYTHHHSALCVAHCMMWEWGRGRCTPHSSVLLIVYCVVHHSIISSSTPHDSCSPRHSLITHHSSLTTHQPLRTPPPPHHAASWISSWPRGRRWQERSKGEVRSW